MLGTCFDIEGEQWLLMETTVDAVCCDGGCGTKAIGHRPEGSRANPAGGSPAAGPPLVNPADPVPRAERIRIMAGASRPAGHSRAAVRSLSTTHGA